MEGQNSMIDEKVYKLKDGEEKILLSYVMFNDKRYLLLSDEMTEDFQVAYEEKNELIYLNKKDAIYDTVLSMLSDKLTKEINEI